MKKARMNISHSRFSLFKLKIFGEIVTTFNLLRQRKDYSVIKVNRQEFIFTKHFYQTKAIKQAKYSKKQITRKFTAKMTRLYSESCPWQVPPTPHPEMIATGRYRLRFF